MPPEDLQEAYRPGLEGRKVIVARLAVSVPRLTEAVLFPRLLLCVNGSRMESGRACWWQRM